MSCKNLIWFETKLLCRQRLVSDARWNVRLYSTIKDRKSPLKWSRPSVPHGTNFSQLASKFNVIDSLAERLRHRYQGSTFSGTQEQFWPDVLAAGTNDSYRLPAGVKPRFAGRRSIALTTEPWLLLISQLNVSKMHTFCLHIAAHFSSQTGCIFSHLRLKQLKIGKWFCLHCVSWFSALTAWVWQQKEHLASV